MQSLLWTNADETTRSCHRAHAALRVGLFSAHKLFQRPWLDHIIYSPFKFVLSVPLPKPQCVCPLLLEPLCFSVPFFQTPSPTRDNEATG
jgi:hypothetical protein